MTRLVSYNIQFGRGRDGRVDLERIAAEVRGADLIALQEVDRHWIRSGGVDQPDTLAALLPEYHWVYGPGVDLDADSAGPDGNVLRRRRQFGNMLLSRSPIIAARNHLLPKYASLGPLSIQRSALECVVDLGAVRVRVYSIHLTHVCAETRLPQIDAVLDSHSRAVREGMPMAGDTGKGDLAREHLDQHMPRDAILLGDFNFEPDSDEYARMVGPCSVYGGRVVNPEGFVDAWVEAGNDPAAGLTADIDGRPVRLDYCFLGATLRGRLAGVRIDDAATGSDHLPLWVELDC